jgi:hypothetical protein
MTMCVGAEDEHGDHAEECRRILGGADALDADCAG